LSVSPAHVSLRGVSKVFPTTKAGEGLHALGPVDLDLARGEFFAVVGPSGCGKSTLLELIAGLMPVSAGTVESNLHAPEALQHGRHRQFGGTTNLWRVVSIAAWIVTSRCRPHCGWH
jgi:ABC-type nitrate/sulfonate/bicarbonate transport system ATPase subunit